MKILATIVCIVCLAGCIKLPMRKMVTDWSEVPPGEVVVVGKLELFPPLQDVEQAILKGKYGRFKQMAVMATAHEYRPNWKYETIGFNGRIEAHLGRPFFAAFPAKTHYYMGSTIFLETQFDRDINMLLPGGLLIDIQPDDKAIYIGTIRYERDGFNSITDAGVVDEYEEANRLFQQKFGPKIRLRKALLKNMSKEKMKLRKIDLPFGTDLYIND